jgi:hypothetical protein
MDARVIELAKISALSALGCVATIVVNAELFTAAFTAASAFSAAFAISIWSRVR